MVYPIKTLTAGVAKNKATELVHLIIIVFSIVGITTNSYWDFTLF